MVTAISRRLLPEDDFEIFEAPAVAVGRELGARYRGAVGTALARLPI